MYIRETYKRENTKMTTTESVRNKRINMRLTQEAYDTIKQAVELQQQDLTSFILGAALERARFDILPVGPRRFQSKARCLQGMQSRHVGWIDLIVEW